MKSLLTLVLCLGISLTSILVVQSASAKRETYRDLMLKDLDQMRKDLRTKVKAARKLAAEVAKENNSEKELDEDGDAGEVPARLSPKEEEAVFYLTQGLELVLSRPDKDNLQSKLVPEIRSALNDFQAFESSLQKTVKNAIIDLKNKDLDAISRSTALIVIENSITLMRPEVEDNPVFRQILVEIRNARIKLDRKVISELDLKSMYQPKNPSQLSKKILKKIEEKEKRTKEEEQRKAKKEAKKKK